MTRAKANILRAIVEAPDTTDAKVKEIAKSLSYPATFPHWCAEAIALRKAIRARMPDLIILR